MQFYEEQEMFIFIRKMNEIISVGCCAKMFLSAAQILYNSCKAKVNESIYSDA